TVRPLTEIDAAVGELAVSGKVEATQAHDLCLLADSLETRHDALGAFAREARDRLLERGFVRSENVTTLLRKLSSDLFGHARQFASKRLRSEDIVFDQAMELPDRVARRLALLLRRPAG